MASQSSVYVMGTYVGYIADGVYHRNIDGNEHILRFPRPSICIDSEVLAHLRAKGVTQVHISERGGRVEWRATLAQFDKAGFDVSRGHGAQRALPLKEWRKTRDEAVSEQMTLF